MRQILFVFKDGSSSVYRGPQEIDPEKDEYVWGRLLMKQTGTKGLMRLKRISLTSDRVVYEQQSVSVEDAERYQYQMRRRGLISD